MTQLQHDRLRTESLDHYARLVCRLLDVPASTVSIIEAHRQLFAGAEGLPEPYATTRQTPLSHSFCQHVVADGEPMVIPDARLDRRVADNPSVEELGVISYAGWPLRDGRGRTLGSLCAVDSKPRAWSERDLQILADLATGCEAELDRHRTTVAEGENLARTLFDSVDVALAFFDGRQRLVVANQRAVTLADLAGFRLDAAPFVGRHVYGADNRTRVPAGEQILPRALRGEHRPSAMQWIGQRGRGQVAVIGSSSEVRHADGTPWGTLVVGHDVTELARAVQVKEEFIATVSHELRTPLTSICGYLEVLADELAPADGIVAHSVRAIGRNADNLKSRIAELLDAGDRGRRLDLRPTDLSALVARVADDVTEQARAAGVRLETSLTPECWARVDPGRIEQAVENLLSNALKFTARGGRVVLAAELVGSTARLSVCDTGVGMTADEVDQAGQRFWRADAARRDAVPGLGIGLSLVRRIARDHAGSLDLLSRPGAGTTATLTLPTAH